ncbi:WS/DGAT/MGAT family O-acyltransferase [Marinobacter sp. F4216]|uniref:WS/DGAT/MGAT family O-acyltransferase n=1 Tax=Marinobacter sp. F4216 TaxID=2874281 RepID=UPI001CBC58AF|nr:wax ester/triacylglycerol synthase family O-acyltransferase [Marinobacter sp. F4216]MBZ2169834.1 wax ester/triacylglycerol synthase family O-acyltransferase [Marinobacter sp. F4216]
MTYKRLSAMDSAFVQLESPSAPMHVAGLMVFERPAKAGEQFVRKLVDDWRSETRICAPWNQKLRSPSRWQLAPVMEETFDPDLEYHVRHLSLPKPGGERELGQMVARLHSQPMDMRKPLWECYFIDGLEGRRFAIYVKFHHALVDGISASNLLMRGLSESATDHRMPPFWVHPAPEKPFQMSAARGLPSTQALLGTAGKLVRLFSSDERLTTLRSAPKTAINGAISAQRRFATQAFELDRLKTVASRAGVTLNDVMVTLVGGSLRHYLKEKTALPETSLTAAIPMSLRSEGDQSIGNSVGMIYSMIGTNIADPVLRLKKVSESTSIAKEQILDLEPQMRTPYSILSMLPSIASMMTGAAKHVAPMFNTVVSNVPGGKKEKYLRGARLLHLYPANIVFPGLAVSFTCYSHAGFLNVGIIACRDTLPQMQRLATGLEDALSELERELGISPALQSVDEVG